MSYGFETVHWLLDDAQAAGDELHPAFLYQVQTATGFVDNVLYPLQEYTYGADSATAWAAQREYDSRPEFAASARPVMFTAEMMFPWMFREIRSLRPFAAAADLLAAKDDWTPLYDPDRLRGNDVPLVAAVYYDDLYVDAELQLDTLARVGNSRAWVTNEYEHDGLRNGPVLERLLDMGAGRC
jgi:proline iminopeptidase